MAIEDQLRRNLAAIDGAIASGVTRANYDGRSVEYRSLEEMRSIRDSLRRQLGEPVRSRRTVAGYTGGFY